MHWDQVVVRIVANRPGIAGFESRIAAHAAFSSATADLGPHYSPDRPFRWLARFVVAFARPGCAASSSATALDWEENGFAG